MTNKKLIPVNNGLITTKTIFKYNIMEVLQILGYILFGIFVSGIIYQIAKLLISFFKAFAHPLPHDKHLLHN